MGRLSDKIALITDDRDGLAAAVAVAFGREGATVVVATAVEKSPVSILGAVRETGAECMPIVMDPTSPASCEEGIAKLVAQYGRLDILCNLAGTLEGSAPIHEITEDDWDRVIAANVKSVLLVSRFAVPALRRSSGTSSIINVSHTAALNGVPGTALLAATKGALLNMTRDMAIQGHRENFRVNCVCLGSTYAPVIPSLLEEHRTHPTPANEVAPIFVYLASDESRHLNGSILTIDDGMHAWR